MPRFLNRSRQITSAQPVSVHSPNSVHGSPLDLPSTTNKQHSQQPSLTSYLVQYDSVPSRNPNGHAIDYPSYKPSRYYVPFANTPRRPRQIPSALPTPSHSHASALHLDFDSMSRTRGHRRSPASVSGTPSDALPTTTNLGERRLSSGGRCSPPIVKGSSKIHAEPHAIQHAINLKILALRKHLMAAAELGDLTVLKRVVSNHRHALSRVRRARHTLLVQLHDATTLTGLPPPSTPIAPPIHGHAKPALIRSQLPVRHIAPVHPSARIRPVLTPPSEALDTPVRRIPGSSHRLASRSVSALKGRSGPSRRSTSNSATDCSSPPSYPDLAPENLSQALPSTSSKKGYVAKLSRKSSGTLKRIGSAGTTLLRRFSRASVGNEPASAQSVPSSALSSIQAPSSPVVSSVLDSETLSRLKTDPAEVIAELEGDAIRLQREERETLARLKSAEQILAERRDVHNKAMAILDQFYGNLPGWQLDPITQAMFTETVDMTDAGLEAERDLAEARHNLAQGRAALKDHELALGSLQTIGEQLGLFVDGLEQLIRSISDCETKSRADKNTAPEYPGDIWTSLQQLEKYLNKSVGCGEMASECCPDAPRVKQIERDLRTLRDGFVTESRAVVSMGRVYQKDLLGNLHVAKSTKEDSDLAESFVGEREKMIAEDVEAFEELVERCEEYVMQERMTLVDIHYPLESCGK